MNAKKIDIIEFSPEMKAYLEEVKKVAGALDRLDMIKQYFEQPLLLAMDKGWGEDEFVDAIRDTLLPYFDVSKEVVEARLINIPADKGASTWDGQLEMAKSMKDDATKKGAFAVIVCNLAEHIDNLNSIVFMKIMEKYATELKGTLLIFWIPYGSQAVRNQIESKLSNVMSARMIQIPPITKEMQIEYISQVLKEKEFVMSVDSRAAVEKWLKQKEESGSLKGFQTLENMCDELIYQKILVDGYTDMELNSIQVTTEDIERMLVVSSQKEDAYELLNELIGMTELKAKVRELVAQMKLQKELSDQGRKIEKPSLHMAFVGNPGTGKTTLARIVGKIFQQEGLLKNGNFYERSGNEFLEGNISEMVRRMRKACKEAHGSVLFFDEAYGMAIGHSNGNTGDDIVPILIEEMENHRDNLCVIFAGYEDEMEAFFKSNSGLKSRVPHILHFPNYNKEELEEIFFQMVDGSFEYEAELKESLQAYLDGVSDEKLEEKEFSNARFVRNLYERVWGKAAYRINFSEDKEIILKEVDLQAALDEEMFADMQDKQEKKRIGFEMK